MNKNDINIKDWLLDECDIKTNKQNQLHKLDQVRVNLLLNSFLKAQEAADKLLEDNAVEGNKSAIAFKRTMRKISKIFQ